MNFCKRPYMIPLFALLALLALADLGAVVMLLWNAIIPGLTGWAILTYPQAVGLLVLCRLLFGGFKKHHGGGSRWMGGGMNAEWREKWKHMNEEQRAEMRARWKDRCGPRWRDHGAQEPS
ncbi:MAG: hypothetical protein ABI432_12365 [Flavobacteriales bacterium]